MKNIKHNTENKRRSILFFVFAIALLVLLNTLGSMFFYRIDLTQEKRFTLSKNSKEIVKKLDDIVYFQVYLKGDLPASYKRLSNSIKEMLDEFRAFNKSNVQYEFIDPAEGKDEKTKAEFYQQLSQMGLIPSMDKEQTETGISQRVIWPCAVVNFKTRQTVINFVQGGQTPNKEQLINEAIENIEFKIADAIQKVSIKQKPDIAFINGQDELKAVELADFQNALSEYYNVKSITIDGQLKALKNLKAIIIAGPDSAFSEKDKFIIDQYLMKGGRALWLVDGVVTNIDSLQDKAETVAIANEINLDDMLFKYGVRINPNVILDLNSCPIPIKTGQVGDQPQFEFYNWYFFPAVSNPSGHPIVKNINSIRMEFASSIDTVGGKGISKTILLSTSRYTRFMNTPAIVSLKIIAQEPDRKMFNKSFQPVAVLLEGQFPSVFANRIPPEIENDPEIQFKGESAPTRMIVVSDGDVAKNQFMKKNNQTYTYPLGYDRYTGMTYGNKDFLLNCVNYLTDDNNLLDIRSRTLKIRLLDKAKVNDNRISIQLVNVIIPVALVFVAAFVMHLLRRLRNRKK